MQFGDFLLARKRMALFLGFYCFFFLLAEVPLRNRADEFAPACLLPYYGGGVLCTLTVYFIYTFGHNLFGRLWRRKTLVLELCVFYLLLESLVLLPFMYFIGCNENGWLLLPTALCLLTLICLPCLMKARSAKKLENAEREKHTGDTEPQTPGEPEDKGCEAQGGIDFKETILPAPTDFTSAPPAGPDGKQLSLEKRLAHFAALSNLTDKEREVLALAITSDITAKRIAERLYISERVCQRYLTSIYEKTGSSSRIDLIINFYNDAWVDAAI